jgi:outer membrane protein TolC
MMSVLFTLASGSMALSSDRVVSLKEAIETSLEGNPEIRAFSSSVAAQKEDVGIAASFLLPQLNFEERFMRTNNPTYAFMAKLNQERFTQNDFAIDSLNDPAAVNDFQTSVSISQALFAPKAFIGLDMARKEFAAKDDEFRRKKEETVIKVFRTYLGVQTAKAFVNVAQQGVRDAEEHLKIARVRYKSELGLYSDTLRTEVAVTSAEERLVSAKKRFEVAKRALGLMLGLTESLDVKEERPVLAVRDMNYYVSGAESRKDLLSLQNKYKNAENSLRMANAGYLPSVGIGGGYQLNDHRNPFGAEGDSWQLMAFLKWNIFDGLKREHERNKAKHQIQEAAAYLDGLRKEISFRVYDAYLGVDEAKKSLDLARKALEAAKEGGRLVQVRYENSLSTIVDLLDVQTRLDTARADVVRREADYLNSVVDLSFQSGTIFSDLGMENEP